ncbi:hypothetical protein [Thermodesulfovibrio sp. Kuro-1]|uniref:hypothetical protein n=1 Tax=Thermodesulfovibrio sp. Kuro-1 TaxID=2580394 RepID=UPI0015E84D56|nr:hypothetical protein [Thermodesulfovibrio sp. Kuro-1]
MYGFESIEKSIYSLFFLLVVILSAPIFVKIIEKANQIIIKRLISILFLFFIINGYLSVFLQQKQIVLNKNMILFHEPSHYALALIPIAIIFLYQSKIIIKSISIFFIILLSLLLQNLTLLLGSFFISLLAIIRIKNLNLKRVFSLVIFIFLLVSFLAYIILNNPYFQERVLFVQENSSVLVYLSGWERAYFALVDSNLIGYGFNRMGYIETRSKYQDILDSLNLGDLNLYDGGTTASKIIYEFGIFGFIVILIYLLNFFKLTKKLISSRISSYNEVLFISYFLSYFFELFIRGVGYFSINCLLFASSFYWIFTKYFIYEHSPKYS